VLALQFIIQVHSLLFNDPVKSKPDEEETNNDTGKLFRVPA
jgi:hypothetical protein